MSGGLGWPAVLMKAGKALGWPPYVSRETNGEGAAATAWELSGGEVSGASIAGVPSDASRLGRYAARRSEVTQPAEAGGEVAPPDPTSISADNVGAAADVGSRSPEAHPASAGQERATAETSAEPVVVSEATESVSRETPEGVPIEAVPAVSNSNVSVPPEQTVTVSRETHETAPHADLAGGVKANPWPAPPTRRVLTTANQKGGVGKTTTTVNVAAALALHGLDVLVIDLDPQGNASTAFNIDHHAGIASIYDVLVNNIALVEAAVDVVDIPGLRCVPATIDLAGAEIELVSVVARELRLKRALDAYGEACDYVLIDCPPSLGLLTLNAMVAGAEILIPIQCEFYALEGLSQLLRNIDLVKNHLNPDLRVSTILLTMYDARTRLADQVATEVRDHFGELVLDAVIPRSVRISEAPGFGQTVLTYDPASRGARAYEAAAYDMALRGERGHV